MSRQRAKSIGIILNSPLFAGDANAVPSSMISALQKSVGIYGIRIAQQGLLEALCTYSDLEITIYTPPQRKASFLKSLPTSIHERVKVVPHTQLLGSAGRVPDLLFDMAGRFWTMSYLRDLLNVNAPVTALHHTLSYQSGLHGVVLPTILAKSCPQDALIMASAAAKTAFLHLAQSVSERVGSSMLGHQQFQGDIEVIPLGVDVDVFRPRDKQLCRKQLGLPDGQIILYMGRISFSEKADLLPLLIQYKRWLSQSLLKCHLVIAGSYHGTLGPTLEKVIRDLDLDDAVIIRSAVPSERHLILAASDVFISPVDNIQETFGLTVIEAMACGVPQVVSNWDGYRETVVDGETGFLAPTVWADCNSDVDLLSPLFHGDYEFDHVATASNIVVNFRTLFEQVQKILEDNSLRSAMSKASRRRAVQEYSWRRVIHRYQELWDRQISSAWHLPHITAVREEHIRPSFFATFSHYASSLANDESLVSFSEDMSTSSTLLTYILSIHPVTSFDLLRPELLRQIIDTLGEWIATHGTVGSSIRELKNSTAFKSSSQNEIIRHCMWLAKMEILRIHGP